MSQRIAKLHAHYISKPVLHLENCRICNIHMYSFEFHCIFPCTSFILKRRKAQKNCKTFCLFIDTASLDLHGLKALVCSSDEQSEFIFKMRLVGFHYSKTGL